MGPESSKILMEIATTPLLRDHFAILVILKFGLHLLDAESLEAISYKPLAMGVYIQHEPANIKDFLRLFDVSSGWRDTAPMMGIPQIVDVQIDTQDLPLHKDMIKTWTACREVELAKRPGELAIIVDVHYHQSMGGRTITAGPRGNFDYISAASQSIHGFFKISRRAFAIVKQGTYPPIPISFENFKFELQLAPMNVENQIEFINADIRWDIQNGNRLRLGTKLPEFEKQMISLASASNTSIRHPESVQFINLIRKKVRSESIYRMAAAYYEHESGAIPKVSLKDLEGIRLLGRE